MPSAKNRWNVQVVFPQSGVAFGTRNRTDVGAITLKDVHDALTDVLQQIEQSGELEQDPIVIMPPPSASTQ